MPENEEKKTKGRRPLWVTLAVVAVLIVCGVVAAIVWPRPEEETPAAKELILQLQGEDTVTLEFGEAYLQPKLTALLDGEPVEAEITVDQPKMFSVGIYTVSYSASYGEYTASVHQTVRIVDTTPPEITLTYIDDFYTEIGSEYEEEGYSAWDAVDGDLTAAVERVVGDGVVTYRVTDSSGNTAQAQRTVVYDDRTPPELTLQGDKMMNIIAGAKYEEPGYTATDNSDGDLTGKVAVSGEYDTNKPGIYTITYSITDSSGNSAEVSRGLFVEAAREPEENEPDTEPTEPASPYVDDSYLQGVGMVNDPENPGEKIIYLTFDDGPGSYTPQLLNVLEQYNVKVTFFVVGTARMDYLDDIAAAGHAIGIHTNTHKYEKIYASEEAFFKDFDAIHEKIYEYTGIDTKLHRFPGGSSNSLSRNYCKGIMTKLVKAVEEKGFRYFDWNVDSNDAGGAKTPAEVYNNVVSGVKGRKTAVVLQHDVKSYSVAAVEKIIQWGLANGYTFLPLDESSPTCHHKVHN